MRKTVAVLLGSVCLTAMNYVANEAAATTTNADEVKTLFLVRMIAFRLMLRVNRPGMPLVSWKPPVEICVPQRLLRQIWLSLPDTVY